MARPALEARRARRRAPRGPSAHGYDPGRERRAEQRARELLQVLRQRGGVGDVPRPRLPPRLGRPGRGPEAPRATWGASPTPTSSTPTSRSWPTCRRPASCSTSTASSSRTRRGRTARRGCPTPTTCSPSGWRSRATSARLITEANMHLPGRQVDPRQVQRDLWRLGQWERERLAARPRREAAPAAPAAAPPRRLTPAAVAQAAGVRLSALMTGPLDPKHKSRAAHRGPRARRRARLPERHRLRRRGAGQADHRRRVHLDRDDALQLPPARARRARSRRASARPAARRWSSTRSRSPTASRWARAGMKTSLVSREVIADSIELVARGHLFDAIVALVGLRQDDPRRGDGARARSTCPRVLLYGGSILPGRFKGQDVTIQEVFEAVGAHAAGTDRRRGAARARGGRVARRRRLRRPVHRQHDGDGLRGPGHLPDGRRDGPGRERGEGRRRRRGRAARDGRARARPAPARHHHARRRWRTRSPPSP